LTGRWWRSPRRRDPALPAIQFFAIDVTFDAIRDPAERRYFMDLPTSFSLTDEQVDRLREIGGRLLRQSPEFQRMLQAPLDR
jgi:NTE family protein